MGNKAWSMSSFHNGVLLTSQDENYMVFGTDNEISIQPISLSWREKSENHKAQIMPLSYNNVLLSTLNENYMVF